MKKKFYFVSAIVAMAMCATLISCEKKDSVSSGSDDEEINGCKCTLYYDGENMGSEKIDIDDMEEYFDVSTCKQLQRELSEGDYEVTCKSY